MFTMKNQTSMYTNISIPVPWMLLAVSSAIWSRSSVSGALPVAPVAPELGLRAFQEANLCGDLSEGPGRLGEGGGKDIGRCADAMDGGSQWAKRPTCHDWSVTGVKR